MWAYESYHPPPVVVGRLMGERLLEVMDAEEVGQMLNTVGGRHWRRRVRRILQRWAELRLDKIPQR